MDAVKQAVQSEYRAAAQNARTGTKAGCGCGTSCGADPITSSLYDEAQAADVPAEALLGSLGCGNPTALAALKAGEIVLDLGSGGGIDVLLSARRVGPTGKAYGLDMTPEMIALARENQARSGLANVEFLEGEIEHIPLPDSSVDVVISNCVINLSTDKDRAIAEAFRVLKPGGRFAVSDVVVSGDELPAAVRRSLELRVGCVGGALRESIYRRKLSRAGFEAIDIEPTRIYRSADVKRLLEDAGICDEATLAQVGGRMMSAFIRATKPAATTKPCCGPGCCS